jgi:anti-anti-sigma factor
VTSWATVHRGDGAGVRLDLGGDLCGTAVARLRLVLLEVIVVDRPDELIIDLDVVRCLSVTGVGALMCGYVTAIEYGTSYRVVNAHGEVRHAMLATGTLDVLTDSDDTGALLAIMLTLPPGPA